MKNTISIVFLLSILSISCSKNDLERDNPLDTKNPNYIKKQGNLKFSKIEVVQDDNNNGKINAGEFIYLKVWIKNIGDASVRGVRGSIACLNGNMAITSNSYSINFNNDVYLGESLLPSEEKFGVSCYSLKNEPASFVLQTFGSVPVGSKVTFSLTLSDLDGNSWLDYFSITIQ